MRLTEQEWNTAIGFLTAAGHITDDKRQEFILLSDVLGASMQTIAVDNQAYENATEETVFGPFFLENSPQIPHGGDIAGAEGPSSLAFQRKLASCVQSAWRVAQSCRLASEVDISPRRSGSASEVQRDR